MRISWFLPVLRIFSPRVENFGKWFSPFHKWYFFFGSTFCFRSSSCSRESQFDDPRGSLSKPWGSVATEGRSFNDNGNRAHQTTAVWWKSHVVLYNMCHPISIPFLTRFCISDGQLPLVEACIWVPIDDLQYCSECPLFWHIDSLKDSFFHASFAPTVLRVLSIKPAKYKTKGEALASQLNQAVLCFYLCNHYGACLSPSWPDRTIVAPDCIQRPSTMGPSLRPSAIGFS